MDPKIAKRTQDTLGKIIKKPPLTDKLLGKPPFRFLHDIMTSVIKTTGFMKGLYTDSEMNSENVKDKDGKMAFLQKAIDMVCAVSGKNLSVKPAKIVAGHEPEKTNEFLQALASSINAKVDNDDYVDKVLNKGKGGSSKTEDKKEEKGGRDRSSDRRKKDDDRRSRDKDDRDKSRDKDRDREDRHKDRDRDERHKDREDKHKDDKHRDREREGRHKSGRSRDIADHVPEYDGSQPAVKEKHPLRKKTLDTEQSKYEEKSKLKPLPKPVIVPPFPDEERPSVSIKQFESEEKQSVLNTPTGIEMADEKATGELSDVSRSDFDFDTPYNTPDMMLDTTYPVKRPRVVGKANREEQDDLQLESELTEEELAEMEDDTEIQGSSARVDRPKAARPRREPLSAGVVVNKGNDVPIETEPEVVPTLKKRKSGTKSRLSNHKADEPQASPIRETVEALPSQGKKRRDSVKGPKTSTPKNSPDVLEGHKKSKTDVQSPRKQKPIDVVDKTQLSPKSRRPSIKNREAMRMDKENETRNGKQRGEYSGGSKRTGKTDTVKKSAVEHTDKMLSKSSSRNGRKGGAKVRPKSPHGPRNGVDVKSHRDKGADYVKVRADGSYHRVKSGTPDKRYGSNFPIVSSQEDVQRREEEKEKENDAPPADMVNGGQEVAPARMQRPSSAKGSRRRMEDVPPARQPENVMGEDDLPPQVAAARKAPRPSSARPAPPKRKEDTIQNEPAMRLGSGQPQNLIIDDGAGSDDDETFVVEESAPPPMEPEQSVAKQDQDDDEDHGGLVKKIMETKKEYEQPRKTDIERPTISDAQRRKQREMVQREIDKLRTSIQTLTRSANPLGKIMDYVQEDLDSMQKELEKWKNENKEHTLALKREKAVTERAVEPLKVQLAEVDQAINDQLDLIGAVKSNIMKNDQKIDKMLRTIAKS